MAVICSLSLLISMATVKSLTSTPGLGGSLLRCQGHIGMSDRQTEGVVSFPLLEAKMPPYVGFAPFSKFVFFTRRHFRERETERESHAP